MRRAAAAAVETRTRLLSANVLAAFRRNVRNTFIAGFVIVFPIGITVVLLWMMFNWLDHLFAPVVYRLIDRHIPGLGIIGTLLIILGVGLFVTNIAGRAFVNFGETLVAKIPFIRNVYAGAKQFLETLTLDQARTFAQVVLLEYPRAGNYVIGFITSETPAAIQAEFAEPLVPVFVTRTPNPATGFLFLLPRKNVTVLPISVEEGLTMVVSGGVIFPPHRADSAGANVAGAGSTA